MKYRILTIAVLTILTSSCGSKTNSSTQSSDRKESATQSTLNGEENQAPLSSIKNPMKIGQEFNTSGWSKMRIDLLGKASERVARIYDSEFDSSLEYLLVEFSGINENGKKSNMYLTMSACEPGGAVGTSGTFRQLIMGSNYENESSGLNLITTGDDEVLEGFKSTGIALYPIESGDASAFIMSQSRHCGSDHDLVVSLGDVSNLPIIP